MVKKVVTSSSDQSQGDVASSLLEAPLSPQMAESLSLQTSPEASNPEGGEVVEIDRVADLTQKEKAAHKAGVTRYKYLKIIAEALEAEVVTRDFNAETKQWEEHRHPDEDRRKWGAEQAGKFFSDFKEQNINIGVAVGVTLTTQEQDEITKLRGDVWKK